MSAKKIAVQLRKALSPRLKRSSMSLWQKEIERKWQIGEEGDLPYALRDANYGVAYAMETGRLSGEVERVVKQLNFKQYTDLLGEMAAKKLTQADVPRYLIKKYGAPMKEGLTGPSRMQLQTQYDKFRKVGDRELVAIRKVQKMFGVKNIEVNKKGQIVWFEESAMHEAKNLPPSIEKKIDKIEADIKSGKISDKEGRKKIGDLMQAASKMGEAIIDAHLAGESVGEIIEKISAYDPRWGNPYPYAPVVRANAPGYSGKGDEYNYPLDHTHDFPRTGHETRYADGHEAEADEYMATGNKR